MKSNQYLFKTLEREDLETIRNVFNLSFSEYFVSIQLSLPELKSKLKYDSIDLALSIGAYSNNQLVAFILHGYKDRVVYNGGTGVVKLHRGNQLTQKMYQYFFDSVLDEVHQEVQLEVIRQNETAKYNYQKLGFETVRELNCYRLRPIFKHHKSKIKIEIRSVHVLNWKTLKSFCDTSPSWSYSQTAIEAQMSDFDFLGAYHNNLLVGYAIVNNTNGKLAQIAVSRAHRRKGIGTQLIQQLFNFHNQLIVINVDNECASLFEFLEYHMAELFITQLEMKKKLSVTC